MQDYFLVAIDSKYNEGKTKSGIIMLNSAWLDDGDMDRNEHKRIYGDVLSVPESFSDNGYRAIDDGMPTYRKFVGHDDIVDRINRGYTNHNDKTYYPSTFDKYDVVTMADIARMVDVRVGDKIYFMPQVTEPENFIRKENGKEIYKVCVTDIICAVRHNVKSSNTSEFYLYNQICMQGEWTLIKPDMETWEEITTKSGIITKVAPDKKWLQGIVAHSRHDHLVAGDKIVYLPNADCEVMVEEEKYFVMPVQDVIGKLT